MALDNISENLVEDVCEDVVEIAKSLDSRPNLSTHESTVDIFLPKDNIYAKQIEYYQMDECIEESSYGYISVQYILQEFEQELEELSKRLESAKEDTEDARDVQLPRRHREKKPDNWKELKSSLRNASTIVENSINTEKGLQIEIGDIRPYVKSDLRMVMNMPDNLITICPILNLSGEFEEIELPMDFEFADVSSRINLNNVNIREIQAGDIASIYTFEGRKSIQGAEHSIGRALDYVLEIQHQSHPAIGYIRQYKQAVGRALRLSNPKQEFVSVGPGYLSRHPLPDLQRGEKKFLGKAPPEMIKRPVFNTETFGQTLSEGHHLDAEGVEEFNSVVSKHLNELNGEKESDLSDAIRRFDEMYEKLYLEDKLVDCAIGFESTLLRDIGTTSSFTFRLQLRGGQLLEDHLSMERDRIHDFFRSIYAIRGDVVHRDSTLSDSLERVRYNPETQTESHRQEGYGFVLESREILGELIKFYSSMSEDYSITQINQKADKSALKAEFDEDVEI